MAEPDDEDLRTRFAALRREDAAAAPRFNAGWAFAARGRTERPRLLRWAPAIALAAVGALLVVARSRTPQPREPLVSLAVTRWRGPTDFLLRAPGTEYLEAVPTLVRPYLYR